MDSLANNKLLISQSFGSFEELATLARAWNTDFRQLSSAKTEHHVLQVIMGGVLMSQARFGCHVCQRGNTPGGSRTFALLEEDCSPVYWFGRKVGPDALLVFPAHGDIESISRPGFHTHTFSIVMDDLADFFERSGGPDLSAVLGPEDTVVPLSPKHLQRLRTHLRKVSFIDSTMRKSIALLDAYSDRLFALLLDIFRDGDESLAVRKELARKQVIEDVVALVQTSGDGRLHLEDLCFAGKVPARTLNEIFRRELGMSPAAFVKGYRLSAVHRDLWRADSSRARVSDVANAWGFWHMGQFAADYQKLFGEMPRATLKRLPFAR